MPTKTGKTSRLHPQGHNCGNGFENEEKRQKDKRSSVFPITKALRDHVEAVVIEKYQDTVNNEKVTIK